LNYIPNRFTQSFNNLLRYISNAAHGASPTVAISESTSTFGETPDIPLQRIVDRYLVNTKFDYVLQLYSAYSVARGFTNVSETDTPRALACLELINDFTTRFGLQQLNQIAMYEAWASGNSFFNIPGTGDDIDGLYNIPLGSITAIDRETDGTVISYQQQLGGTFEAIPADQVAHFKISPKNGSAFGEMLGQPMERQGLGYKTSGGNTVRKASEFSIDEMTDDVSSKMFYSGQPKYIVTPADKDASLEKSDVELITNKLTKTDPLKHFITNKRITIATTELSTQSKHDAYISRARENFIIGTKSAVIPLITALDFSYASSQTALETAIPLIIIMQSEYTSFINQQIYRPLIIQAGKNPDKIKISIKFKTIDRLTIDLITQSWNILQNPKFDGLYKPEDIVQAIRDVGMPLDEITPAQSATIKAIEQQNRIIRAIQEVIDNKKKAAEIASNALDNQD